MTELPLASPRQAEHYFCVQSLEKLQPGLAVLCSPSGGRSQAFAMLRTLQPKFGRHESNKTIADFLICLCRAEQRERERGGKSNDDWLGGRASGRADQRSAVALRRCRRLRLRNESVKVREHKIQVGRSVGRRTTPSRFAPRKSPCGERGELLSAQAVARF